MFAKDGCEAERESVRHRNPASKPRREREARNEQKAKIKRRIKLGLVRARHALVGGGGRRRAGSRSDSFGASVLVVVVVVVNDVAVAVAENDVAVLVNVVVPDRIKVGAMAISGEVFVVMVEDSLLDARHRVFLDLGLGLIFPGFVGPGGRTRAGGLVGGGLVGGGLVSGGLAGAELLLALRRLRLRGRWLLLTLLLLFLPWGGPAVIFCVFGVLAVRADTADAGAMYQYGRLQEGDRFRDVLGIQRRADSDVKVSDAHW